MNLNELKDQALEILTLQEKASYSTKFLVKSGGKATINKDVEYVKDHIVIENSTFKYKTQYCGNAIEWECFVFCCDTGAIDKNHNRIYLLPDNKVFAWSYHHGDSHNFDRGAFVKPLL